MECYSAWKRHELPRSPSEQARRVDSSSVGFWEKQSEQSSVSVVGDDRGGQGAGDTVRFRAVEMFFIDASDRHLSPLTCPNSEKKQLHDGTPVSSGDSG